MRWLLATIVSLIAGCAQSPEQSNTNNYPLACEAPIGLFANVPLPILGAGEDDLPALADLFFEDGLAGFPIEAIDIQFELASNELIATGILAGEPLEQQGRMRWKDPCAEQWQFSKSTGLVDGSVRFWGAMLTTAMMMPMVPLSDTWHGQLTLNEENTLLIRLSTKSWLLLGFVIPWSHEDSIELRYPAYVASLDLEQEGLD